MNKVKSQKSKVKSVIQNLKLIILLVLVTFSFCYASLPIARDSLSCGLKVLTYQSDRLPLIEMRWVSYSGSAYDPTGKEGLANLTNKMLTRGTKNRSALKISQELEFVGASLSDGTGYDVSTLHMRFLSKDLDLALDILSDALLNSVFSDTELMKVKVQTIGDIKQSYDYPYDVGWEKFTELVFKNHPYGHSTIGDTASVPKITRKDIVDFYNKYFTVNNGFLIVAGDFNKTELLKKIEMKFSSMRNGIVDTKIPALEHGPYSDKPKGYIINQADLNQSYIFIGQPGMTETSPDYFPSRVMNFILGGSPLTSRIGAGVRETQGLAYDARSFFDRRLYGGLFAATTQTSDPNKGINTILNEIKKMSESGATLDELKNAKTFYIGNFPFNYDATREKIDLLQGIEVYNKGLDYPEKFNSFIEKITLDEINQAAKTYLFPNNYLLVIVTNVPKESLAVQGIDWLN
jgi:zinc protease